MNTNCRFNVARLIPPTALVINGSNHRRADPVGGPLARPTTIRNCFLHSAPYTWCLLSPGHVIGAVYLRAGYSPDDYPTPAHWAAREKLERSAVAKCPSVAFQLSGAKKVPRCWLHDPACYMIVLAACSCCLHGGSCTSLLEHAASRDSVSLHESPCDMDRSADLMIQRGLTVFLRRLVV